MGRRHGVERCTRCALRRAAAWRAEAGGLASMLMSIAGQYDLAVEALGGESELLRDQIFSARRYVIMRFDDKWHADARLQHFAAEVHHDRG